MGLLFLIAQKMLLFEACCDADIFYVADTDRQNENENEMFLCCCYVDNVTEVLFVRGNTLNRNKGFIKIPKSDEN